MEWLKTKIKFSQLYFSSMTEEQDLERILLGEIYESSSSLISSRVMRPSLIENITNHLDGANENNVEYQLTVLEEDGLVSNKKRQVQVTRRGLERYEELGGDTNLDDDLQEEILNVLLEAKKNDPRKPRVGKQELIDSLSEEEETVAENVWALNDVGYVELQQSLGTDYHAVSISSIGRRALEQ